MLDTPRGFFLMRHVLSKRINKMLNDGLSTFGPDERDDVETDGKTSGGIFFVVVILHGDLFNFLFLFLIDNFEWVTIFSGLTGFHLKKNDGFLNLCDQIDFTD